MPHETALAETRVRAALLAAFLATDARLHAWEKRLGEASHTPTRLRAMNKSAADVLHDQLETFRDDLMRAGQSEAARGMARLLREFDFVTRRFQRRRA